MKFSLEDQEEYKRTEKLQLHWQALEAEEMLQEESPSITSLERSVESHYCALAAE
ncbi:MAG: hypothetical protein ACI4EH_03020 [Oliverpabstia sp.]